MATHFIIKLNSSLEFINSFYYDTFNSITFLHYIFLRYFSHMKTSNYQQPIHEDYLFSKQKEHY